LPYENVYGKNFEDMMRRVPSTDKLHKMIGYIPQSSLDTILEKTINFYKLSTNKKDG
jgi:UDP-glucose 4-epimerase